LPDGNDLLKSITISTAPTSARTLTAEQKKHVAVAAFTGTKTVAPIAIENSSSRKFVRSQRAKAAGAIDVVFHPAPTPDKVLFQLPVTQQWMDQLTLSLWLCCKGSYRNATTLLIDVFDSRLASER